MTKPKTKTAPHKHTCDKCGKPFTSPKAWAKFCSTACRVNAHQADRYADNVKARRAEPRLRAQVHTMRLALQGVMTFLERDKSDEGRALLAVVREAHANRGKGKDRRPEAVLWD